MTSSPLDEIFKTIKPLVDEADRITKFAKDIFGDIPSAPKPSPHEEEEEPVDPVTYKHVAELGLADALVLDDGSWQVVALQGDGFDSDIVSVTLENGETYDLLRSSLVRVV